MLMNLSAVPYDRSLRLFGLLVLLALFFAPLSSNADTDLSALPPTLPVKVSVGLHVSNLGNVNQASETFEMNGYLLYSWKDPRLAFQVKKGEPTSRSVNLKKIWNPAIEMVNVKSSQDSTILADVQSDGTVLVQERFARELSIKLRLKKFPFDRQALVVALESLKHGASEVQLVAAADKISIGTDSFVSLSEWGLGKAIGVNSKSFFAPEDQWYSRVNVEVPINRNAGFYFFKIMIPLLLITIASWSVFWINPQEFSTQIGVAFTNLLTIVALLLVINDSLPKVGYMTYMDGFTSTCFMTILIGILALIIAHHLRGKERYSRADQIQKKFRVYIPLSFLVANILLVARYL
jgi:hypothetical protein